MSYQSGLELARKPQYRSRIVNYSIDPHMEIDRSRRPSQTKELQKIAVQEATCHRIKVRYTVGFAALAAVLAGVLGASLFVGYLALLAAAALFWSTATVSL